MASEPSGAPSEATLGTQSIGGEATPAKPTLGAYPPYPPYVSKPVPPSVAETIIAGRDLRVQHKSQPRQPVRPLPRPAKPKGPKATDVKLNRRATRQHARCLRRHGAVLTDRLERIAKPPRRSIIYLWREHADTLPPETIARLRTMLDADEPFKPDQAYEYFINVRKTRKGATRRTAVNQIKKDVQAICADKRFVWARNATVLFARGIQQRLTRPGRYALADGMLRLSNIIMDEICGYMKMKTPSRRCTHPKAKFMMEMSDKVAVWIDEILSESDDRMLMMDFDEDEDLLGITRAAADGFADDFLNMMGDGGLLTGPTPAYLKFTGEMLEAFMILTDSMTKKGKEQLLSHGKFQQTYAEGADELKQAPDFEATEFNTTLAKQLNNDLTELVKSDTPPNIAPFMKDMVEICSNYLAQVAENNKDKGPAFKALVKQMKTKSKEQLYQKDKSQRTFGQAATELEKAKGLDSDYDDPNLSQEIHSKLSKMMEGVTPADLKEEMSETVDICSKYLSQNAVNENERGPAFDILIKKLETDGGHDFTPQYKELSNKYAAAYTLKAAPGFSSVTPDPPTVSTFNESLHRAVDDVTPSKLQADMNELINRCSNYLSAFVRDRDRALQVVLKAMKSNGSKELAKRNNYAMNYSTGATEVETAPMLVPFLPVKDIADENKEKLTKDVQSTTPPDLKIAVKSAVTDVSKHLSQPIALRSGAAGERYGLAYLGKMMKSLGTKVLFKHKSYGQTYSDGSDVLKYAGPLESDPKAENLQLNIRTELNTGVPSRTAPTIVQSMAGTIEDSAKHLAKVGHEKGEAVEHLVQMMKEEGDTPLANLQGYEQTYKDGARRIEIADSLVNEKVDKGAYEGVRSKLTAMSDKKSKPEHAKVMPAVIDETSKFLASPFPETTAEKRRVLADLMARKGTTELAKEGVYKIDYTEGGKEIMNAPVGVTDSHNPGKKKEMEGKINAAIPDSKLQDMLKDAASEGAAHLTDVVYGRGEAMGVIKRGLEKEGDKEFLNVGKFNKTHKGAADMLDKAPGFGGENPNGIILNEVSDRIGNVDKDAASPVAIQHMDTAVALSSGYIADQATKECGLDAKGIDAWGGGGAGGGSRTGISSRGSGTSSP
ncbi:uncharacterized protein [Choristoneura fumiferana]|uniref:uncharacterized protein n=1 Tax=Choristoneura fumiferana TaxID=7141 RepID=UPI003D154249